LYVFDFHLVFVVMGAKMHRLGSDWLIYWRKCFIDLINRFFLLLVMQE